jgi:hypothetical protein
MVAGTEGLHLRVVWLFVIDTNAVFRHKHVEAPRPGEGYVSTVSC